MRKESIFIMLICSITCLAGHHYYVAPVSSGNQSGNSWENASNNLYEILSKSETGDTIWVASGTYKGGFYWRSGVTVMGGFSVGDESLNSRKLPSTGQNLTILDGDHKFRVISQPTPCTQSACFDGFVIRSGNGVDGAGVIMKNGSNLKNCVIDSCVGGLPSVGEATSDSKGVIFDVDQDDNKLYIISASNVGRLCQLSRAKEMLSAYSNGSYTWSLPTAEELRQLVSSPSLELVASQVDALGQAKLSGTKLWSNRSVESAGMEGAYVADLCNWEVRPTNEWQYNLLWPVSCYVYTIQGSNGGGINASNGAVIENCIVRNSSATYGSGIYARNQVVITDTRLESNEGQDELDVDGTVILNNTTGISEAPSESNGLAIKNPIEAGQVIPLSRTGFNFYEMFDLSGKLIMRDPVTANSVIIAPNTAGNYILKLMNNQKETKIVKLLVK
jgi:hypothetical protein